MAALQAGDPERIGPYVLLGRLGSGGMGRVYLARSPGGRMVAVKVIRAQLAEDAGFRARFAREVSAASKVGGLFTAQVVDADLNGPIPWLVTAYVPGTSLSNAVEQHGPLPAQSVLALAAGLAEGLSAIHAAGVIHRDLKPSNILLAQDGPRIIDFGISSAAEATALTGTGFMIGSPGFMSPEQAEGLTVGPASDIFSLAGLLIYAARGEGPFGSGDTAALLYRVVHGKPNIDQIPDDLRPLIRRSLSRDPARRPTAPEFLAELSAVYPSAADLSDWLPPRILDVSARRDAAQQPSIAGTFGSGFGAEVPAFGAGAAAFEAGAGLVRRRGGHRRACGRWHHLDRSAHADVAGAADPAAAHPGAAGARGAAGIRRFRRVSGCAGSSRAAGLSGRIAIPGASGVLNWPGRSGRSRRIRDPGPAGSAGRPVVGTAEVFYANAHFWPKGMAYPGTTAINSEATKGCNTAFAAYDGITYSKSMYSWADIIPDTSTWPNGDRALHCVAYYAPPSQPAGATVTGSIRGSGK